MTDHMVFGCLHCLGCLGFLGFLGRSGQVLQQRTCALCEGQCAQAAEKAGAHGVLLLTHYPTEAGQEGLAVHVEAVRKNVNFGVVVNNDATSCLKPETLAGLAERTLNLVGFKGGDGRHRSHGRDL